MQETAVVLRQHFMLIVVPRLRRGIADAFELVVVGARNDVHEGIQTSTNHEHAIIYKLRGAIGAEFG